MPTLEAQSTATRVMHALTGRRWTWPMRHVIEQYYVPETVATVNLSGRPVSGVNSVVDEQGVSYQFRLSNHFKLWFPALRGGNWWFPWPIYDGISGTYPWLNRVRGTLLTIDYIYGSPPSLDVQRAIDELATQLDLIGSDECQLPSRVTSVNREGVSWTVLDPMQFLVGGKTGLYYPDLVISMYGNGVKERARVFSPEHRPPNRIFSEIIDPNTNEPYPTPGFSSVSQRLTSQLNPNLYITAQAPSPYVLNSYDTAAGGSLAPMVPLAASVAPGSTIGFKKADSAATTNTLTLILQGSDTFPGGGTSMVMATTNEVIWLTSDGSSVWTRVDGDLDIYDGGTFS